MNKQKETKAQMNLILAMERAGVSEVYYGSTKGQAGKYIRENMWEYEQIMDEKSALDAAYNDHGQWI